MPIRINKFISQCGSMSRRAADEAVAAGRVMINAHMAQLGDVVDPSHDEVRLDGKALKRIEQKWYLALYKPKYMLTTMHDPMGRSTIKSLIPKQYTGVFPAGRLDFDAEGLILLTNDGELAHAIHHPSHDVPKIYRVKLVPRAEDQVLNKMAQGIMLDGELTRPAQVKRLKDDAEGTLVEITLRQGLKNQIKRMAQAVDLSVKAIERLAIGPISAQGMRPGSVRELTKSELSALKKIIILYSVT